ncbi:MAG: tetratricopeptide repeat protein [Gemmatales bacterium]|nr:tetratricopeptide repeat protein [Gemmatales bacterium]MDW7994355.1 tetratricopeptide repeat protein [Gemmatales bacterium]
MLRGRVEWVVLGYLITTLSLWSKPQTALDPLLRRYEQLRRQGDRVAAEAIFCYLQLHHGHDPQVQVLLAREAMRLGQWDYALALLADTLRLDDRCIPARMARAELLRRMNRLSEAMQDLEVALRQAPQHDLAERMLGLLRLMQGQWDAAILHLTRYINSADDQDGDVYCWRGLAWLRSNRPAAAEVDFARASELAPDVSEVWLYRAQAAENQGKLEVAAQAYARYLAANPQDTEARLAYVRLLQKLRRPGDVLRELRTVLELQPGRREVLELTFQTARQLGQYHLALEALEQILQLDPDHLGMWFQKALLLQNMSRPQEALAALAEYEKRLDKKTRPGLLPRPTPILLAARGEIYRQLGQLDKALAALDEALKLNPQYGYAYSLRADVYWRMGKVEAALDQIETALQINSQDAYQYLKQAEILVSLRKWDEARKAVERAVQVAPEMMLAGIRQATTLLLLTRWQEALPVLTRLAKKEGQHPADVFYAQAILAGLQGYWDEAERSLEQFASETPLNHINTYNLACTWSLLAYIRLRKFGALNSDAQVREYKRRALDFLEKAFQLGYRDRWHTVHDPDFFCLHNEARFWHIVGKDRPFTEP